MKEHPDYFSRPKRYDIKKYTRMVINWYHAEILKEKDINLLYHFAEIDFSDEEQVYKEYKEIIEG